MSPTLRGGSRTSVSARIHAYRSTSHPFGCRNKKGRPFGRPSSILFLLSIPSFALWTRTGRFADARMFCDFQRTPVRTDESQTTIRQNYLIFRFIVLVDILNKPFVDNPAKLYPKTMGSVIFLFRTFLRKSIHSF